MRRSCLEMSLRSLLVVVWMMGMLALGGCSTLNDYWQTSKTLYYTYLNTPATIDYESEAELTDVEALLATRIMSVDSHLKALERHLANADRPPTPESVMAMFDLFPWISGFSAVDPEGNVLAREPPDSLKQLDFTELVASPSIGVRPAVLVCNVQETALGPEVLVGVPINVDGELRGVLVVNFDMRALLLQAGTPDEVVVLYPGGVLSSGKFDYDRTPLAGVDWAEMLRESSTGTVGEDDEQFAWISRYIGRQPIIFAAPARASGADRFVRTDRYAPIDDSGVLDSASGSILLSPPPAGAAPAVDEHPVTE